MMTKLTNHLNMVMMTMSEIMMSDYLNFELNHRPIFTKKEKKKFDSFRRNKDYMEFDIGHYFITENNNYLTYKIRHHTLLDTETNRVKKTYREECLYTSDQKYYIQYIYGLEKDGYSFYWVLSNMRKLFKIQNYNYLDKYFELSTIRKKMGIDLAAGEKELGYIQLIK